MARVVNRTVGLMPCEIQINLIFSFFLTRSPFFVLYLQMNYKTKEL